MRKRFLNWGLLAILAVLSLALGGCGSQAVSGNSKGAAAFDAETLRAGIPYRRAEAGEEKSYA